MPQDATTVVVPAVTDEKPQASKNQEPNLEIIETPTEPVLTTRDLTDDELLERLANIDPKKILAHNKMAGIVGSKADELARKREQDNEARRQAEWAAKEQERLRQLRKDAPIEYIDEIEKQEAAAEQQKIADRQTDMLLWAQFQKLPQEIQTEFSGKQFPTRQDYLDAVTDRLADLRAEAKTPTLLETERARWKTEQEQSIKDLSAKEKAARERWETEQREAIRKELLGQTVGSEPSPDAGAGNAPNRGALTDDEWQLNKKNPTWKLANVKRIQDAMNANRLRS